MIRPCRSCGKDVDTDARFCPQCGAVAPTPEARRSLSQDRWGCLIATLLPFLALVVFFATC